MELMGVSSRKYFLIYFSFLLLLLALKIYALNSTGIFEQLLKNEKQNDQKLTDVNENLINYVTDADNDNIEYTLKESLLDNDVHFAKIIEKERYLNKEHDTIKNKKREYIHNADGKHKINERNGGELKETTEKGETTINENTNYGNWEILYEKQDFGETDESKIKVEEIHLKEKGTNLPINFSNDANETQEKNKVDDAFVDEKKKEKKKYMNECLTMGNKEENIECDSLEKGHNEKGNWMSKERSNMKTEESYEKVIDYNEKYLPENQFIKEYKKQLANAVVNGNKNKGIGDTYEKIVIKKSQDNTTDDSKVFSSYKKEENFSKDNLVFMGSANTAPEKIGVDAISKTDLFNNNEDIISMGMRNRGKHELSNKLKENINENEIIPDNINTIATSSGKRNSQKPDNVVVENNKNKETIHGTPTELLKESLDPESKNSIIIGEKMLTYSSYNSGQRHENKEEITEDHIKEQTAYSCSAKSADGFNGKVLNVFFTENLNLYVNAIVGNQLLKLAVNSRLEGTYVFMKQSPSCYNSENVSKHAKNDKEYKRNEKDDTTNGNTVNDNENYNRDIELEEKPERTCYDPYASKSAQWCNNNTICLPSIITRPFECFIEKYLHVDNQVEYPNIYYDSLRFNETHVEGSDHVVLFLTPESGNTVFRELNPKKKEGENEVDRMKNKSKNSEEKVVVDTMHLSHKDTENEILFKNADIKLVFNITFYPKWNTFKDVEGMIGLAGEELSCRNKSVWNQIIEEHGFLFAIDINLPKNAYKNYEKDKKEKNGKVGDGDVVFVKVENDAGSEKSEIHLGDYKKNYGEIIWAEPRERGGIFSDSLLQFTIYNLEVCGKNIFGKYSSNWQGVIDLSSKCLILPKLFWLSLMEYLPVNRNDTKCIPTKKDEQVDPNDNDVPRMCSVDIKNRPLPLLKFVFSDNDIVNSNNINEKGSNFKEVLIPLDNLIISDDKENENYLCVLPDLQEGLNSERNGRTTKPLIKFGTYVLNNLYVVADQENYRVGFAQKKNYYYSNEKCTKSVECIGDQHYEPALNMCIDPDCSVWYFYALNEETKKCESLSFKFYFFIAVVLILLGMDIQSYFLYRKAIRVAKRAAR